MPVSDTHELSKLNQIEFEDKYELAHKVKREIKKN